MNRKPHRASLALAVATACGATQTPRPGPGDPVVLTAAPSQPEYAAGEAVEIRIDVRNAGADTVRLSAMAEGNLQVLAFARDGAPLPPRTDVVDFDLPLEIALEQRLREVSPGHSLTVTWSSVPDRAGGLALEAYVPGEPAQAIVFGISGPGLYKVTLRYRYGGPAAPDPAVYRAETGAVTVAFRVR
jgi:hypothetical protein